MRLTLRLVLAACLIGAIVAAVEAQASSPAPGAGTRVELPEHGFATTLPDGWLIVCPWSETAAETLGGSEGASEALDEEERLIVEKMAAMFAECQFVAIRLADEGMEVSDVCKADAGALGPGTLDSNVTYLSEALSGSEDPVAITTSPVDLPAGRAAVIDVEYRTRTPRQWAYYVVEGTGAVLVLSCLGPVRPADDWLSIAETFEFLPAEE